MKQKKRELMMQALGKYCLDMSKLIFGGVVIGSLLDAKENWIYLLIIGTIMFFVLLWIGNRYYNQGNNNT